MVWIIVKKKCQWIVPVPHGKVCNTLLKKWIDQSPKGKFCTKTVNSVQTLMFVCSQAALSWDCACWRSKHWALGCCLMSNHFVILYWFPLMSTNICKSTFDFDIYLTIQSFRRKRTLISGVSTIQSFCKCWKPNRTKTAHIFSLYQEN